MEPLSARVAAIRPVAVMSSPARRCSTPARRLADQLDLPLRLDPDLLELDFGAWEGVAWDAVSREALDRWAADPLRFAPPGGESGASLIARMRRAAARLRDQGGNVLVVSHGGPLRLLPAILQGQQTDLLKDPPPPGSLEIVTIP